MADADTLKDAAQDASDSAPMGWAARVGLAARGVVYLLMGWLAILVALGSNKHIDQRGALTEVLDQPFGSALVVLMALGFAAYALWRLSEAAFGVTGERDGAGPRLKSLARGLAYLALTWTAISLLRGARGTQADQQGQLAADVMAHSYGRWLVGLAGVVLVGVGLMMVHEGWSDRFLRYFGALPPGLRRSVIWLGRIGTVSRGVVFAITGVLVVIAAWRADPDQAGGIDAAFRTLLEQPFGPALVALLGVGLLLFGVYGLAEAAWRRVPDGTRQ
ncbi:MAG TPA: DUF1206 domain-containing protein [Candidatus Nanopelagicales bacterium]